MRTTILLHLLFPSFRPPLLEGNAPHVCPFSPPWRHSFSRFTDCSPFLGPSLGADPSFVFAKWPTLSAPHGEPALLSQHPFSISFFLPPQKPFAKQRQDPPRAPCRSQRSSSPDALGFPLRSRLVFARPLADTEDLGPPLSRQPQFLLTFPSGFIRGPVALSFFLLTPLLPSDVLDAFFGFAYLGGRLRFLGVLLRFPSPDVPRTIVYSLWTDNGFGFFFALSFVLSFLLSSCSDFFLFGSSFL